MDKKTAGIQDLLDLFLYFEIGQFITLFTHFTYMNICIQYTHV